jgi:hypothetical protein
VIPNPKILKRSLPVSPILTLSANAVKISEERTLLSISLENEIATPTVIELYSIEAEFANTIVSDFASPHVRYQLLQAILDG